MLTLNIMATRVGNRIQKTDASFVAHIKDWIDERYGDLWRKHLWQGSLRSKESGVTFVATDAFLQLPKDVDEIILLTERSDNKKLFSMSSSAMWTSFADVIDNAGKPINYSPMGDVGYIAQNAAAETLSVVSSSASDISQTVRVWCLVNGEEISETVTLTGTTKVSISSTCDANGFLRASKDADTVGVISVTGSTSSTVLTTMAPEEFTAYYKRVRLRHVPDAADTVSVVYKKKRIRLVNDEDIPEFDCSEALIAGALADAWMEQEQFTKAGLLEQKFEIKVNELIMKTESQGEVIDQAIPFVQRRGTQGPSEFFKHQS